MPNATPVKTDSVSVLAHQVAIHPTTIVGSAIDCRTKRAATIFLYHGYIEAAADTNRGRFLVQVRPDAGDGTVNEHWATVAEFFSAGGTPEAEALTATEPIGETTLAVASTTNFAANDIVYIRDTTTLADSEWGYLKTLVTNTNLQLIDGLTVAKDSADIIYNRASVFVVTLDLNSVESFRVVWQHQGAVGADAHIKALAITHDSDLIA